MSVVYNMCVKMIESAWFFHLLNFSLKKVVSLSRGHVVAKTHLHFGFRMDGLKAQ